jgi:hypothetical protein
MSIQPQEVQAILARIGALERQNRRLKRVAAGGILLLLVVLSCAFANGGQGGQQNQGALSNDKQKSASKHPGFVPVPQQWTMPDGRVVEFPASTSKEEVDALAKRMADGDIELPPRARVVGWEPYEGANSLLPRYQERVATIPTTKAKLDALANAAGLLQTQIDFMKADIKYAHARIAIQEKQDDRLAKVIDGNTGALANDVSYLTMKANQLDDLKSELDDFKAAACPLLRRAAKGPKRSWDDLAGSMTDQSIQMKIDSTCGPR